jgi:uncharacterized coiled-coil protein SlyX
VVTDYSELVERMRAYPANRLCIQFADALEAQAKRIAHLESHGELNEKLIQSLRDQVTEGDARIAELEAALKRVLDDIEDYERVNNLSPSPGKQDCWESVSTARAALNGEEKSNA